MQYDLHLDTSVFGALLDRADPRRVEVTRDCLRRVRGESFRVHVSALVIEEVARAPASCRGELEDALRELGPVVLEESSESLALAEAYLDAGS